LFTERAMSGSMGGVLYVVATPIGNLEDVTQRALRVLREVDWIAAEDTRVARRLLARFAIPAPPILSCFVANEARRAGELAERLAMGEAGALVTEAGTPGISDPGAKIVRAAVAAGARVVPVPGASAVTAALCTSGFPADRFSFLGFLPTRGSAREGLLDQINHTVQTLVLYESPRRAARTLADLSARSPERACMVFREITKVHEEAIRGTLEEVAHRVAASPGRGEYVIVLGPTETTEEPPKEGEVRRAVAEALDRGASVAEASKEVARRLGVPRGEAYRAGLAIRKQRGGRKNE
jgi:16S rRNA (cytidine1402-2'-O)-methyltransferase